jgi:hypothetical protein
VEVLDIDLDESEDADNDEVLLMLDFELDFVAVVVLVGLIEVAVLAGVVALELNTVVKNAIAPDFIL